ncbi:hypothetical protein KUCAC02_006767, partial [Chaenocephalus aceratus]
SKAPQAVLSPPPSILLPSFCQPPAICSSQLPFSCFSGMGMKKGRQKRREFTSEGWG